PGGGYRLPGAVPGRYRGLSGQNPAGLRLPDRLLSLYPAECRGLLPARDDPALYREEHRGAGGDRGAGGMDGERGLPGQRQAGERAAAQPDRPERRPYPAPLYGGGVSQKGGPSQTSRDSV